ncbi:hypothetical protein R0131_18130 [Clostridium sp. AL.422]|uniref:hypothetical protein n=1 Tax=Clostridium TaxID=1485 RepID=UPI00293DA63D|nr:MULTISPECIES: hypothetical protein [unclassified Clostridium]MDV4152751.1 hypothetical protein [Clostridium sp. AL.422]
MGVLFSIIGITLSFIASITLVKSIMHSKGFVIKKAKIIGFEAYTYLTPGIEYNTVHNTKLYPIIEIKDGDKVVKIAVSIFENRSKLEKGDEIEVIYPKGKIDKLKIYSKKDIYNFYYLTLIMGLLITLLSISII